MDDLSVFNEFLRQICRDITLKVFSQDGLEMLVRMFKTRTDDWYQDPLFVEIDYAKPSPLASLVSSGVLEGSETYRLDKNRAEPLASDEMLARGSHLGILFDMLEEAGKGPIVHVKNPQLATLEQMRYLSGLVVHAVNCASLPHTRILLPGGDWWYRPDFSKTTLPDGSPGGNLNYIRSMRIANFDPTNFYDCLYPTFEPILKRYWDEPDLRTNIYGPMFSGKSLALESGIAGLLICTIVYDKFYSVYPGNGNHVDDDAFFRQFAERGFTKGPILIDDAHLLKPETVKRIWNTYKAGMIATSRTPLDGFDEYIDAGRIAER